MSHSLTKIWIHGIFGTKDRAKLILPEYEKNLHAEIQNSIEMSFESKVRIINGTEDHVHILFLLSPNFCVRDIFKNIKGGSSHWWNQQNYSQIKFAWQTGYGAFSVSESKLRDVEKYIRNQKEHHRKITYQEEVELFVKKYGIEFVNR
ncbi:MAG: IS200/IS605 family transposase [bacterium]